MSSCEHVPYTELVNNQQVGIVVLLHCSWKCSVMKSKLEMTRRKVELACSSIVSKLIATNLQPDKQNNLSILDGAWGKEMYSPFHKYLRKERSLPSSVCFCILS